MWNLPGVNCSFLGKSRSLCLEATRMIKESLVQMHKSPISSKTNPKECVGKNIELSCYGATSTDDVHDDGDAGDTGDNEQR